MNIIHSYPGEFATWSEIYIAYSNTTQGHSAYVFMIF